MKPVGPYSPIVEVGNLVVCSGQLGLKDGVLVDGGVPGQLTQAISNLVDLLDQFDLGLDSVFKTTVFLENIDDYSAMNEAYVEAFGDVRPARSAVAVDQLPLGAAVEIEAWAYRT